MMISFILVLLFYTLASCSQDQDLDYTKKCTTEYTFRIITCSDQYGFTGNITKLIEAQTNLIIIKENKKVHFKKDDLISPTFSNIRSLIIEKNDHLEIDDFTFKDLPSIKLLRINKNKWKHVNRAFSGAKFLQLLNLGENNIESLEAGCFNGLRNLETLVLSKNKIKVLPTGLFVDLINLYNLFLDDNQLEYIYNDTFNGLHNVNFMDLAKNKLVSVNASDFNVMKKLRELYLHENDIATIKGKFVLPELMFLSLNRNKLQKLDEDLFDGTVSLKAIFLGDNSLSSLTEQPFYKLNKLSFLNLTGNSIPSSHFSNLSEKVEIKF